MAERTYETEFRPGYEIPGILLFLVKEGILQDLSWHNDVSPSFGIDSVVKGTKGRPQGSSNIEARIWVDHPIERLRETGGRRFVVTYTVSGDQRDAWGFDDLEAALGKLFSVIVEHQGTLEEIPEAWPDLVAEYSSADEILSEILDRYYRSR